MQSISWPGVTYQNKQEEVIYNTLKEGQLSDGKKLSFKPNLHSKFEEAQKAQCSVALQNCFANRSH